MSSSRGYGRCRWLAAGTLVASVVSFGPPALAAPSKATAPSARPGPRNDTPPEHASYARGPVPAWVDVLEVDRREAIDPALARDGVHDLLHDVRWRFGAEVERYVRHVRRAVAMPGVDTAAQIRVEFEPRYQKLVLHHVTIWREGRAIDGLATATERLLDRETQLERRIYRGTLTLDVVLSDVRVGDVVDFAYTIVGANPVLGRAGFAAALPLSGAHPTRHLSARVRVEGDRPLFHRLLGRAADTSSPTDPRSGPVEPLSVELPGGARELRWERFDTKPAAFEDRVPGDYDEEPWVQLSSFGSWADVVAWAGPLFALPQQMPASLVERARELARGKADRDDVVTAVLRFVQDDIRYLSVSLGPHSHTPHDPARVLEQRFGDCKDKALLFVALLRALDIEAQPALVDADRKAGVRSLLPSPFAFDHVVVRVRRGDGWTWVDPTHSNQGGTLSTAVAPSFGVALPIGAGVDGLAEIDAPQPTEPQTLVETEYFVASPGHSTRLEVTGTFRGASADDLRERLSRTALAELGEQYLEYYAKRHPTIRAARPVKVQDDRVANVLVVREVYEIPAGAAPSDLEFEADNIGSMLREPKVTRRHMPLALDHPVWMREVSKLHLPWRPELADGSQHVEDKAFTFTAIHRTHGTTFERQVDYRSHQRSIPAEAVADHLQKLAVARQQVTLVLPADAWRQEPKAADGEAARLATAPWVGLVTVLGLAAAGAVTRWQASRPRRARRSTFRQAAHARSALGETAELPIRVQDESEARSEFAGLACPCGGPHAPPSVTPLTYEGSTLHALRSACQQCGVVRRRYYIFAAVPLPLEQRRAG